MIKVIIFDFGGVVLDWADNYVVKHASEIVGINGKRLRKEVDKYSPLLNTNKISEKNFWSKILRDANKDGSSLQKLEDIWNREFEKRARLNKNVVLIVKKLKKNYKVALLSNIIDAHAKYCRKKKYFKGFGKVFLSSEIKMVKPDAKIYRFVLRKLNIKAHEAIFIDDKIQNVKGARKVGIHAFQFRNISQLKKDLNKLGIKV